MSTGPEFEGNPNLRVSALSATSPALANLIYCGINYRLWGVFGSKNPSIALSRVSGSTQHR